jgi:hypothetical protein
LKTILDWSKFAMSGQICLSTQTLSVISALIRGLEVGTVTNVTKGAGSLVDPNIPSHCFITFVKNDLIKGIEMTWPKNEEENFIPEGGVNVFDLGDMVSDALVYHIVMLARPPFIPELEDNAIQWIKDKEKYDKDKYGIWNLFAYMGIGENHPHEQVCSQFTATYLNDMQKLYPKYSLPIKWYQKNKVSPYDQLLWFKENKWNIPFTKQVNDSYYPNEEIIAPND